MTKYLDLIVVTVVLTTAVAMLTYVDAAGDRKGPQKQQEQNQHKDAAGQREPHSSTEKAVQKDRESSQHLGAGDGTSSGTGAGKMQPGSGPR